MIETRGLTKRYGPTLAVDDLSFTIQPGRVTGFLGPNGAGKSTTMRMILGLDRPTSGQALINGRPYHELDHPLRTVGALLDAKWVHPNRSARSHLRWLVHPNRLPPGRVDEVLDQVGLTAVAGRRAGAFSLGMSQRLGIAGALLGDPEILLFDEPVNGLDPVPAANVVRAGQAAWWYSLRMPPSRCRRRMSRWVSAAWSVVGCGSACSGRALAMPWWGRWVL
jgi:ABC-2 type transport system ATP-binding protein